MDRIQSGTRDGIGQNTNDHEFQSTGNNSDKASIAGCEPIERKLWNPNGLVLCRSCGASRWLQSMFGRSATGLEISALLCRDCFDLCVVRHVKYDMPQFIMAAYYVATLTSAAKPQYEAWKPDHTFNTMASRPAFDRLQPAVPPGFCKGKLWNGKHAHSRK